MYKLVAAFSALVMASPAHAGPCDMLRQQAAGVRQSLTTLRTARTQLQQSGADRYPLRAMDTRLGDSVDTAMKSHHTALRRLERDMQTARCPLD